MPETNQKLVVRCFMMSVDGFAAGLNQRLEQPFGDNTEGFTDWMFATRSGNQMLGLDGGEENEDDHFVAHSFDNIGATILGRNMFATSRGPWTDDGKDVRLMGGAASVRQYLAAELIDELHLIVVPMLIGKGERVFPEDSPPPGYTCVEHTATPAVIHLRFERR